MAYSTESRHVPNIALYSGRQLDRVVAMATLQPRCTFVVVRRELIIEIAKTETDRVRL